MRQDNHPSARCLAQLLLWLLTTLTSCGEASNNVSEVTTVQESADKFSCEGRSSGFYADLSSGCQMYHMCDEAGRVFTHACPERTLFQQRTMVCDHWYMVECSAALAALRATTRAAPAVQGAAAARPQGAPALPGRKRHSQRVAATFPYQREYNTTVRNATIANSSPKLESFKISSFPSNTPRSPPASAATVQRVSRPSFVPGPLVQDSDRTEDRVTSIYSRPSAAATGRATIERVFKDPFPISHSDEVVSQVQYLSPFREGKSGTSVFSTTSKPSTQVVPSLVENKYKENPFFESYFRTSFAISTATPRTVQTTTLEPVRRDEEENAENKLEIVIPDPRKMFYIPDSNYDPGDASKDEGTVFVIDLPVRNTMKFQRVGVKQARNHDCPQCHPSFLIPGLCRPCVLIRR